MLIFSFQIIRGLLTASIRKLEEFSCREIVIICVVTKYTITSSIAVWRFFRILRVCDFINEALALSVGCVTTTGNLQVFWMRNINNGGGKKVLGVGEGGGPEINRLKQTKCTLCNRRACSELQF